MESLEIEDETFTHQLVEVIFWSIFLVLLQRQKIFLGFWYSAYETGGTDKIVEHAVSHHLCLDRRAGDAVCLLIEADAHLIVAIWTV